MKVSPPNRQETLPFSQVTNEARARVASMRALCSSLPSGAILSSSWFLHGSLRHRLYNPDARLDALSRQYDNKRVDFTYGSPLGTFQDLQLTIIAISYMRARSRCSRNDIALYFLACLIILAGATSSSDCVDGEYFSGTLCITCPAGS